MIFCYKGIVVLICKLEKDHVVNNSCIYKAILAQIYITSINCSILFYLLTFFQPQFNIS